MPKGIKESGKMQSQDSAATALQALNLGGNVTWWEVRMGQVKVVPICLEPGCVSAFPWVHRARV